MGLFIFVFFCFLVREIPFAGIELTSQRVRGLRGTSELPGRPDTGKTLRSKAINSDSELFAIVLALFNSSKFEPVEVILK